MKINLDTFEPEFIQDPESASIPQKNNCCECPFVKTSVRGFTTHDPARRGTYHGASGVLNSVGAGDITEKFPCHVNPTRICEGHRRMKINLKEPSTHKECFDTWEEIKEHHVINGSVYDKLFTTEAYACTSVNSEIL